MGVNFEGVNIKIQNLYMYNFFFHLNWTKKTPKLQDIIHIYISKNAYLIFMLFSFCSVHDNWLFAVFVNFIFKHFIFWYSQVQNIPVSPWTSCPWHHGIRGWNRSINHVLSTDSRTNQSMQTRIGYWSRGKCLFFLPITVYMYVHKFEFGKEFSFNILWIYHHLSGCKGVSREIIKN